MRKRKIKVNSSSLFSFFNRDEASLHTAFRNSVSRHLTGSSRMQLGIHLQKTG